MHAKSFYSLFFINYYVKTGPLSSNESLQSDLYPFDEKISVLHSCFHSNYPCYIRRVKVILINLLFLLELSEIFFFFFFFRIENAFIRKLFVLFPNRKFFCRFTRSNRSFTRVSHTAGYSRFLNHNAYRADIVDHAVRVIQPRY